MEKAAAESAFKRELLFSQGRFKTKTKLKVDQLFSIGTLYPPQLIPLRRAVNPLSNG